MDEDRRRARARQRFVALHVLLALGATWWMARELHRNQSSSHDLEAPGSMSTDSLAPSSESASEKSPPWSDPQVEVLG